MTGDKAVVLPQHRRDTLRFKPVLVEDVEHVQCIHFLADNRLRVVWLRRRRAFEVKSECEWVGADRQIELWHVFGRVIISLLASVIHFVPVDHNLHLFWCQQDVVG